MKMTKISITIMTFASLLFLMISCGEGAGIKKDLSLNNELDSISYAIGIDIAANVKRQGFNFVNFSRSGLAEVLAHKCSHLKHRNCFLADNF